MCTFSKITPEEILSIGHEKTDLIISNHPIPTNPGIRTLVISPFFTESDYVSVNNALSQVSAEKKQENIDRLFSISFSEKLFFRNQSFSNKYDAIDFLGNKMVDIGLVDASFIASVLKREQISSTCFFDSFAIPHAIDLNAKRTMFGVLISKDGVQWDEHRIHIVMMIAVQQKDRHEFMELYNGIVNTLQNPEKISRLISSQNINEFIDYLRQQNNF